MRKGIHEERKHILSGGGGRVAEWQSDRVRGREKVVAELGRESGRASGRESGREKGIVIGGGAGPSRKVAICHLGVF